MFLRQEKFVDQKHKQKRTCVSPFRNLTNVCRHTEQDHHVQIVLSVELGQPVSGSSSTVVESYIYVERMARNLQQFASPLLPHKATFGLLLA